MAQLACRFTFLDVLLESEERVMAARGAALRARSANPSRGWSSLVGPEVAEDQAEMQSYVSTLLPSIGMVPPVTGADLGTWASEGSIGHPNLCTRPCLHVVAGRLCPLGKHCAHCHLLHRPVPKLDKWCRSTLEQMPRFQFLALMVELLQEKAADSLLEADALLDVLGAEMSATDEAVNSRARGIGRGSLQRLMQRLRRINFANLVAMAARRCEDSRARLLGALQDLRAQE